MKTLDELQRECEAAAQMFLDASKKMEQAKAAWIAGGTLCGNEGGREMRDDYAIGFDDGKEQSEKELAKLGDEIDELKDRIKDLEAALKNIYNEARQTI